MPITPVDKDIILATGGIKRIHVVQANLRKRMKDESANDLCYTVKWDKRTFWGREIEIDGPCRLVERINDPLPCGARLWIETTGSVRLKR